jgi:SpoVK/Ycf46/Vps4 family AAA+-type ATPase
MALKTFTGSSIDEFNNKDLFLKLQNKLSDKYEDSEELVFLLGNIKINDFNIDALIIKSNCILMLCLNNYSGELFYSETGKWKIGELKIEIGSDKDVNPLKEMKLKLETLEKFLFDNSIISKKNELNAGPIAVSLFDNNLIFDNNALSGKNKKWLKISDVNSISNYVDICFQENIDINKNKFEKICDFLNAVEFDLNSYYNNDTSIEYARSEYFHLQNRKFAEYLLKLKFELELLSFQNFSDFSKELYQEYGISTISEIDGSLAENEMYDKLIVKPYNIVLANKIKKGKEVLDRFKDESELNVKKGVEYIVLHSNQLQQKIELEKSKLYTDKNYIDFLLEKYCSEFKEVHVDLDFERHGHLLHNMIYVQGVYSIKHVEEYFYYLLINYDKKSRVEICSYLIALNDLLRKIFADSFSEIQNCYFGYNSNWASKIMEFIHIRMTNNIDYYDELQTPRYFIKNKRIETGHTDLTYISKVPIPSFLNNIINLILVKIKQFFDDNQYNSLLKILNLNVFVNQTKFDFHKASIISKDYNRTFDLKIDFEYLNANQIYQLQYNSKLKRNNNLNCLNSFNVILDIIESDSFQIRMGIQKANKASIDSNDYLDLVNFFKLLDVNTKVLGYIQIKEDLETLIGDVIDENKLIEILVKFAGLNSFFGKRKPIINNIKLVDDYYIKIKSKIQIQLTSGQEFDDFKNSTKDNQENKITKNFDNQKTKTEKKLVQDFSVKSFDQELIGYEDVKLNIREHLQNYFDKEIALHLKLSNPDGLLFYGLPGCGKTFFANWIAKEINYKLIEVPRTSFGSQYVDGAMNKLMEKLKEIYKASPSVVFFDEFDSVATNRDKKGSTHNENDKVVNTLLQEIPKLIKKGNIIIAATNFIENLDAAVIRSGRFGPKIPLFPPMPEERALLFKNTISNIIMTESPIRNFLIKNNMFESDFVKTYTDKMLLFSNSDVVNIAETFCKKLYKLHNAGTLDLEYLDLESDINKFKIAIEQFEKFYYEISLFNSEIFYDRINNLKMEIDIYKNGRKRKKKIGY